MGKYGLAAEIAAKQLVTSRAVAPREAWNSAVIQVFPDSDSSQKKGCPRDTFLALCEMGLLENVPMGDYTQSVMNKDYAKRAIAILRKNPRLLEDEKALWQIVIGGADKVPNHQMNVVTTLWRNGLLRIPK